jgi:hypothetical protein
MPERRKAFGRCPANGQANFTRLRQSSSPLADYILIGTLWGGDVEPVPNGKLSNNAVPGLLSNITLETYIQNYVSKGSDAGIGSSIDCHANATLAASKNQTSASCRRWLGRWSHGPFGAS